MVDLSKYDSIFFDLDGVVYLGDTLIAGVDQTIKQLRDSHKVGFITNNASRTCAEFADKLSLLNIPTREEEVISSPGVLIDAICNERPKYKKILAIASSGVKDLLIDAGYELVLHNHEEPDLVVNGLCKNLNWEALAEAGYAIGRGVEWWATNLDPVVPTDQGLAPGNGSIVALLNVVTGKMPRDFGKPNKEIFLHAFDKFDVKNPLFIGDTLGTDIKGAENAGVDSVLVLTGNTSKEQWESEKSNYQTVGVLESVNHLLG
jgi:glycerol-1-phosphatase